MSRYLFIIVGGSAGTGSSGYHSEHNKEKEVLKKSHIEFEDSEEEGGDSVIVTGGINFLKGDKAVVTSQVDATCWQLGPKCKVRGHLQLFSNLEIISSQ